MASTADGGYDRPPYAPQGIKPDRWGIMEKLFAHYAENDGTRFAMGVESFLKVCDGALASLAMPAGMSCLLCCFLTVRVGRGAYHRWVYDRQRT
jgi:hypothetical protein